jgi:adenosylcobyric acid synthase
METTLTDNKTLRNVCGYLMPNQLTLNDKERVRVKGYEIHAGISQGPALDMPLLQLKHSEKNDSTVFSDGVINADNNIIGTYVHGLLDEAEMLKCWLQWAGSSKVTGLTEAGENPFDNFDYNQYKDTEINRLADVVEKVMPLQSILCLLGLEE